MNGRIGFLKVPIFFFSLSRVATVCPPFSILLAPRRLLPISCDVCVSPVNSFVILRSLRRSLRHRITSALVFLFLRLLLHHRFAPRTFRAFSRVALCVSLHLRAYLTFVLLLCICVPLCPSFLPAASEACISFGRCNIFSVVIYPCAAPLNYARNYAYSERAHIGDADGAPG